MYKENVLQHRIFMFYQCCEEFLIGNTINHGTPLKNTLTVNSHFASNQRIFFRWEDGNNLTSNLFTLITPLTTHTNISDICSYKPYTEKY